ncbi:sugar ABC transporter permease [Neobacillus sp. CF12]|uniref:carbohydrate ABC transporter permease n=1 Tax=Neobacillus sp. CF12 TaxID=3055864 RepID=UPI0025A209F6|nr:sugar ABC transporter permease [Neobacillus sp. CF12]MDM5326233.1 sugar ABC transporter permease [Neobacillus sp. CF12]
MFSKQKENRILLVYVLPALIVYLLFKLYPAILGFYYSLTDWNGIDQSYEMIGWANFKEIFEDVYFWESIQFTFKYVVVILVVSNVLALLLAVLIESRLKARGLFRTLFYMPNMISMIIGGYMWVFIFTRVIYYLADNWGLAFLDQSWIGDPRYSFVAIIIVSSWGTVGYLMLIYMAALQGVPLQLKEAAVLDGANSWNVFRNVTFPMIQHAFTICIFWSLSSAFQVFDVIYALTGGGPGRATQSVALNIYEEAFKGNIRYGYATAKSTILFVIVFLLTLAQLKMMKRKEQEL